MTSRGDRIAALVARGREQREDLAGATIEIRAQIERRKAQWKAASLLATGLAVTGTVAYRLFGRTSLSARISRAASGVSLLIGLARAFTLVRRPR